MAEGTLNWKQLRHEATQRLRVAFDDDRSQEARWIVERVSGYSASELVLHDDEPVSVRSVAFFDELMARREAFEPLQYVLGRWSFRTLELLVDRRVLIPRPETETVAGIAIDLMVAAGPGAVAVDLGTGTGAIALSIAVEVPGAQVWATDVSPQAMAVAGANLAGLGRPATRVRLATGSWFDALDQELRAQIDVIVSNPPYVRADAELAAEVLEWEPHSALFAGDDGLDDIRLIVANASIWLRPGGWLVVELSPEQAPVALELATAAGLMDADVRTDLSGRQRALVARRPVA